MSYTPPKPKTQLLERECLKCGKKFDSTGPGNRLCGDCNASNSRMYDGVRDMGTSKSLNSKPFLTGD